VATADSPGLKVAFLYMKGRLGRLAEVETGTAPTEFFYGAIEMSRRGFDVRHFEIDLERPATIGDRVLGRLWPRQIRPVKLESSVITQVYRLVDALNGADCIVATGGNWLLAGREPPLIARQPLE